MIERIEKLMNSSCKEDILIAMHLVKHYTGIKTPIVLFWWIDRRTDNPWMSYGYHDKIKLRHSDSFYEIEIYHSELE